MWATSVSRAFVVGASLAVLVVCCVLPLAYMLAGSLAGTPQFATPVTALGLDPRQRGLLYNTAILGSATSLLATIIGAPLGVALARVEVRQKALLRALLAAPLLLPPYVVGLAWVSMGRHAVSSWTYSMGGAVLVLTLVFYPVSMLATEVAVRRIDPRLEEAGLIVARSSRVLWHITLRLAAPSLVGAALVIFVLAISEFGVPGLLGVRVFTTEVLTAFAALYDFRRATVLALPLLLLSSIVAAIAVGLLGEQKVATRRGAVNGAAIWLESWKTAFASVGWCVVVLALVLPLTALMREASAARSWTEVVRGSSGAIGNSLLLSSVGATATVAIGLPLGYVRARASRPSGMAMDVAFVVLFAVPSTVVGIGLIGLWNRPGLLGALYGTPAMLLLVYLARLLPVAALGIAAAVRQVPTSHEEAASTAGAGWARTMTHIMLPQLFTSIAAMWVVVFVFAFGELGASILVAPPGETTLPIRIYTLIANAPPADVAALALLQSAVVLSPLMLLATTGAARDAE